MRNTLEMIQDRIGGVRYYEKIDKLKFILGSRLDIIQSSEVRF